MIFWTESGEPPEEHLNHLNDIEGSKMYRMTIRFNESLS